VTSSKPLPGRSLAELRPEIARQWHPTKNGDLNSYSVTAGSGKKVWWLGDCGHEWDAPPTSRTSKNAGCPVCVNKRVIKGLNDLATIHPNLAKEWHPTKNGDLTPFKVSSGSSKRVWWFGECGHEWDVTIVDRVHYSTGCPFCNGNLRIMLGINDLASIDPELAKEWHPTKNGDLKPSDVRQFSIKKVWWRAVCGHEWLSTVAHRSSGRGCPFCSGKKLLAGFNDIETTDPEIASQWHPTKNGDLTTKIVSRGSDRKVWWFLHGHEWTSTVSSRIFSGQGCAICSGDQVQIGVNDLSTTNPDVIKRWHPTKNDDLAPHSVTLGSGKKVWWLGECGHSWITTVKHMTSGRGCAVCRGLQIELGVNDLASQYPDLAAQWHPTKNGDLTPQRVTSSSGRKVWWMCEQRHEWRTGVSGRQYGAIGCPDCASFGFSPSNHGWLYLLFHPIWDMQQIGISNVPESRVRQHARLGWQVVEIRGPMEGSHVQALEKQALQALRARGANLGVRSSNGGFDGHTEAWSTHTLQIESIRQLLNWVYSDDSHLTTAEHIEAWTIPKKIPREANTIAICVLIGCERKHHGHGYCRLHYRRWIATGDTGSTSTTKTPNGTYKDAHCLVSGCLRQPRARGFCSMHYARWSKSGDPGEPESRTPNDHDRTCIVDGCSKPWTTRKMCEIHYRRFMSNGDPTISKRGEKLRTYCLVEDCDHTVFGHGYCNKHYKRFRKYGDPLQGARNRN